IYVLIGFVGRSVFRSPPTPDQELVETNHVEQRVANPNRSEQIRTLCERGAHQQATIGAAANGETRGRSVLLCDQVLGGGEEIVKDVLLLLEHARPVPGFAVFASTAQVGLRIEAALLHPPGVFGIPMRSLRKQEAAIRIHESGHASVLLEALL